MAIAFVKPETVTLPLSDGDSIVIRKRLTHGESDDMFARMRTAEAGSRGVRAMAVNAYLLTWSSSEPMSPELSDDDRIATLNGLDPDSFVEIEQALAAHVKAQDEERDAKKKARTIPIDSAPISGSVV